MSAGSLLTTALTPATTLLAPTSVVVDVVTESWKMGSLVKVCVLGVSEGVGSACEYDGTPQPTV